MRIFRYLKEHNLELQKFERKHRVFVCYHCWSTDYITYRVKGEFACEDCLHSDSFYEDVVKLLNKIERRKIPWVEIRE